MIQLCLFFIVPFVALSAFAEEPSVNSNPMQLLAKDVFFQPGGGVRVRYDNLQDASGGAFGGDSQSQVTHRAQMELGLYKGESFETHFRFINAASWGLASPDINFAQRGNVNNSTGLLVNLAYAHWKITESLGIKFGRAPLNLGLGYTYGANDWFDVPYSFDQVSMSWDWEPLKASLIVAKVLDLTQVEGETSNPDPQENHVIFHFDIKSLHEAIRSSSFSLVQVNRDAGSLGQGEAVLNGLNMQRVAFDLDLLAKNFFMTGFFTFVSGEERISEVNQVDGRESVTLKQMAYDLKAGYRFPESNKLRVWAGYHYDSGNDSPGEGDGRTFDSFYYEVYGQSGLMDLFRWGNLNFWRVGLDAELTRGLVLGAEFLSLKRSEATDLPKFGVAGRFLSQRIQDGDITLGSGNQLGNELDIWLDWTFESGMNFRTTVGSFFPGEVFKSATTTGETTPNGSIIQVLTQLGYFF